MSETNKNISGSDVTIEFLELVSPFYTFDLQPYFIEMNIYEDLYSPSLTMDIVLNDSVNLPQKVPILGEEYLNFSFASKSIGGDTGIGGDEINPGYMYVTSITDRHITKDKQQVYILHLTSEQSIINYNTSISRSFRGKLISEIAETLLNDYIDSGNDFVIEQTDGLEHVVIPNWKPFKAINWLTKLAVNTKNIPSFLFWESIGVTYFKSVETLLEQESKHKFILKPTTDDKAAVATASGITPLTSLEIINQFDIPHNITIGLYSSKLITHDIVRKKIEQTTYGLNQAFGSEIAHTDEFMPISSEDTYYEVADRQNYAPQKNTVEGENIQSFFDSKISLKTKHDKLYCKHAGDLYDNNVENILLKRNALINGLNQIKLQITFSGISFLRVGFTVDIDVPSPEVVIEEKAGEVKNKEEMVDKMLSGTYLITALKHSVIMQDGKPQYGMTAEVTKDGLGDVPAYGEK
jgi:hypothetical protein